jgi:hypothetical protein
LEGDWREGDRMEGQGLPNERRYMRIVLGLVVLLVLGGCGIFFNPTVMNVNLFLQGQNKPSLNLTVDLGDEVYAKGFLSDGDDPDCKDINSIVGCEVTTISNWSSSNQGVATMGNEGFDVVFINTVGAGSTQICANYTTSLNPKTFRGCAKLTVK